MHLTLVSRKGVLLSVSALTLYLGLPSACAGASSTQVIHFRQFDNGPVWNPGINLFAAPSLNGVRGLVASWPKTLTFTDCIPETISMCWESAVDDGRSVWVALPINFGCQETTSVSVSLENSYEVVIRSSNRYACAQGAAAPQTVLSLIQLQILDDPSRYLRVSSRHTGNSSYDADSLVSTASVQTDFTVRQLATKIFAITQPALNQAELKYNDTLRGLVAKSLIPLGSECPTPGLATPVPQSSGAAMVLTFNVKGSTKPATSIVALGSGAITWCDSLA
jgi:hypothetical protein